MGQLGTSFQLLLSVFNFMMNGLKIEFCFCFWAYLFEMKLVCRQRDSPWSGVTCSAALAALTTSKTRQQGQTLSVDGADSGNHSPHCPRVMTE